MSSGHSCSPEKNEEESSRVEPTASPDFFVAQGLWEVEPHYYSLGKNKERRGKAYRNRTDGEYTCFEAHDNIIYRPNDQVFMESSPLDPFVVVTIGSFKFTKRDLTVTATRYYRPEDVPEVSLSIIAAERGESGECGARPREVFSSDTAVTFPVSALRGQCSVISVKDVGASREVDLTKEDVFFTCLTYQAESLRLASVPGAIRIGPGHQARLPPEATSTVSDERDRDQLIWRPGQIEPMKEEKYIRLARTFRMCLLEQSKIHGAERQARVADLLIEDAISTLHRCGYQYCQALNEMNANDRLLTSDANFMTNEDTKKFGKGIRTIGKNFTKISRELLPLHSRDQLVAFYYLWKKTSEAIKPKQPGRVRSSTSYKKNKNGVVKNSRPGSTDLLDYASASEADVEGAEEPRRHEYACHHCYSNRSKDWHHAQSSNFLLCTDCRMFFKKYGQLRPVDRPSTVPPCLFKRNSSDREGEEEGVRTRAGKKERRRSPSGDERSPSTAQSVHEFDCERKPVKNGKRKKNHALHALAKKRKEEEGEKEKENALAQNVKQDEGGEKEIISPCKQEKEESEENIQEDPGEGPSTDVKEPAVKKEDVQEEVESIIHVKAEDDETVTVGTQLCEELIFPDSEFVRHLVRSSKNTCSRTDIFHRMTALKKAAVAGRKRKREEDAAAAANQPPPVQPVVNHAQLAAPQPRKEAPHNMQTDALSALRVGVAPLINGIAPPAGLNGVTPGALHPSPHPYMVDPRFMMLNPHVQQAYDQQMMKQIQVKAEMEAYLRRQQNGGAPQAGLPQAPPQVVASLPQAPPPSHLSQHPMMIDGRPPMMMTPHELEIRMQMEFLNAAAHQMQVAQQHQHMQQQAAVVAQAHAQQQAQQQAAQQQAQAQQQAAQQAQHQQQVQQQAQQQAAQHAQQKSLQQQQQQQQASGNSNLIAPQPQQAAQQPVPPQQQPLPSNLMELQAQFQQHQLQMLAARQMLEFQGQFQQMQAANGLQMQGNAPGNLGMHMNQSTFASLQNNEIMRRLQESFRPN